MTGDKACDSNNVEQNNHEESNGEDKVLEELEELWELLCFLLAVLLVLLSKELSNVTGECITDAVEVADCDGISTNKLVTNGWHSEGSAAPQKPRIIPPRTMVTHIGRPRAMKTSASTQEKYRKC